MLMGLIPVEANKIDRGERSKHRRSEALQGRGDLVHKRGMVLGWNLDLYSVRR